MHSPLLGQSINQNVCTIPLRGWADDARRECTCSGICSELVLEAVLGTEVIQDQIPTNTKVLFLGVRHAKDRRVNHDLFTDQRILAFDKLRDTIEDIRRLSDRNGTRGWRGHNLARRRNHGVDRVLHSTPNRQLRGDLR